MPEYPVPDWHERPTMPGTWLAVSKDMKNIRGEPVRTVHDLDQEDFARGVLFHCSAVYGPIPPNHLKDNPMSEVQLGKIITDPQQRDAIHIAVAPVVAHETLKPGTHVGFLPLLVVEGEACWMLLYPNTITALRHEWTHPAFTPEVASDPEGESKRWIEGFAAELDQTYNRLMDAARLWVQHEDYTRDDSEAYKDVDYSKWPVFWNHFEVVTGIKVKVKDTTATFFTCSC